MVRLTNVLRAVDRWRSEGIELLPPGRDSEVIVKLAATGHLISRDVIELYCTTGGMAEGEMNSTLLTLWSLDRVVAENAKHESPVMLFADFLIDSHCFGLKYENENESSVHVEYSDGQPPRKVADSLDEFFRLQLDDPAKVELMKD